MIRTITQLSVLLASVSLLVACGGSGSSGDGVGLETSNVSVRFSDAPIEGVTAVVITVDSITFNREGEDIVVDTFTSDELGIVNANTFQIDLLEVQGNDNRLVLDVVELPVGEYQNLRIGIIEEDTDFSYVEEEGGDIKTLKVPGDELKLGSFTVSNDSAQTFVVEFGLRQAMTYNPGPERYILKPRGVRIAKLEDAATISGSVDLDAIHLEGACSGKGDQTVGNVAYLYTGHDLETDLLGDVFIRDDEDLDDPEIDESVPEDIIAPVVSEAIDGATGDYLFSYILPGDYTLAISCLADGDHPVTYDEFAIPAPETEIIELHLEPESSLYCDFPNTEGCTELE